MDKIGVFRKTREDFNKYTRTRLKRYRIMRHLGYNVIYSVVPINSALSTITLTC